MANGRNGQTMEMNIGGRRGHGIAGAPTPFTLRVHVMVRIVGGYVRGLCQLVLQFQDEKIAPLES